MNKEELTNAARHGSGMLPELEDQKCKPLDRMNGMLTR